MSNKLNPQDVARNKRQEAYQYDFQNAKSKWETEMASAQEKVKHKATAVGMALKLEKAKSAEDLVEQSRVIEAYLNESIDAVEFVPPKNPAESNIVTLNG